jgi:hypothetical protein
MTEGAKHDCISGVPERAGLTSAALCPDGATGGVVGRTQGARVPSPDSPVLSRPLGAGKHRAPVGPVRTLVLPTG